MHSLVCVLFSLSFFQVAIGQTVCKSVSCYGQAVCHEVSIPCTNSTASCFQKLAQCMDKTIEDYTKDLVTNRNIEQIQKDPNYLNSNDKDVLCQGFNCYGLNTCVIIRVPCVDNPSCINYQPSCDDSPIPTTT